MRRVLLAVLFVGSSVGFFAPLAAADGPLTPNLVLSFNFSDNSQPAAASNGAFNIITNVLPEQTGGVVRMIASAPAGSGLPDLVCGFQLVQKSQVECDFNFTTSGVWTIHSQYANDVRSPITSVSITRLRVDN